MRKILNRNENWFFCPTFQENHKELRPAIDFHGFQPVRLPHNAVELPLTHFDENDFQIVSSYLHCIKIEEQQPGMIHRLRFEGAMAAAKVYVDGTLIREHAGGFTEFTADFTAFARGEEDLLILVELDSREREDIPPFGHVVDFLTYSGIYREVQLEILPVCHIEDIFPRPQDVLKEKKSLQVDYRIDGKNGDLSRNLEWEIDVFEKGKENEVLASGRGKAEIGTNNIVLHNIDALRWELDAPVLHYVRIRLLENGASIDETVRHFGFRQTEFTTEGFFLNGLRVPLLGLNRHQSYPYVGYAMPKSVQQKDADILKYELGVNVVRESHYPQSRHFLDRCDEIGLLAFSEIPGWQHIGNDQWQANVLESVREMILRDRHRPSVIIWGVRINESPDCRELYTATNRLARELDPTRPTGGVRNFRGSEFLEDVFTYNDFIHSGDNRGADKPVRRNGKKVPYLITEHNGHMHPTKKTDNEQRRLNQALRHLKVIDDSRRYESCAGVIGWCMNDYNTHKDFGSGDGICHHGVLDMFRLPKTAAGAYSAEGGKLPYGLVSSEMHFGDLDGSLLGEVVVFTNSEKVKLFNNSLLIGTFFPDRKRYPHLSHPPVRVNDFIGDRIHRGESFSRRDADAFKKYFLCMARGKKPGLSLLIRTGLAMAKNRLGYREGYNLYTKYVVNWGTKATEYRFEGHTGEVLDWSCTKAALPVSELILAADRTTLREEETWDAVRCVVRLQNSLGQTAAYGHQVVRIGCDGPGEIIGPNLIALQNGSAAFWIKTVGKKGQARITAEIDGFGKRGLEILVE